MIVYYTKSFKILGSCQDNDQKCERYKKYCGTSKYLEENCQKSCGLCGGSGGGTGGSGGSGGAKLLKILFPS